MTTFQAVIYAISHAVGEFFPIGSKAHHVLISYLVDWSTPGEALLGALSLGSFLALLIFFRHDWSSMISSFIQVIIYRKRPMTLDERMPLFITLTTVPIAIAATYFHDRLADFSWTPPVVAGIFAAVGLPLLFFDRRGRKSKGMFDWNWLDAIVLGVIQIGAIVPGWDHLTSILIAALFLNYRREAAAKYGFYAAAPLLIADTIIHTRDINFHAPSPGPDLSWLSFGVGVAVSLLVGLLAIGAFMKHIQSKGFGQYVAYRWILAAGVCIFYWYKS